MVLFCRFLTDSISFIFNIAFVFVFSLDVDRTSVLVIACVIFCALVMLLVLESWFMLVLSCCVLTKVAWMTDEVWTRDEHFFTSCLVSFLTFSNTKYCRQVFYFLNSNSTNNQIRHCITILLSKKTKQKKQKQNKTTLSLQQYCFEPFIKCTLIWSSRKNSLWRSDVFGTTFRNYEYRIHFCFIILSISLCSSILFK